MTIRDPAFPVYTRAERGMDTVLHLLGVPSATVAAIWLIVQGCLHGGGLLVSSLAIYAIGLVGMLVASAAYHLVRPSRAKELLRRADHAMIFVMIAGSYTPFALNALSRAGGAAVCAAMWAVATLGVVLKFALPRRYERVSLVLCLIMGWTVLALLPWLVQRLPGLSVELLIAGGLAYTVGAALYTRHHWRFHTVYWHALVLVGAGLHLGAVSTAFLAH